jgi:hypothetical protein
MNITLVIKEILDKEYNCDLYEIHKEEPKGWLSTMYYDYLIQQNELKYFLKVLKEKHYDKIIVKQHGASIIFLRFIIRAIEILNYKTELIIFHHDISQFYCYKTVHNRWDLIENYNRFRMNKS